MFSVTLAHYDCGMKGEIIKEQQSTTADSIHVYPPPLHHPLHVSSVKRQHKHLLSPDQQQELAVVIERDI